MLNMFDEHKFTTARFYIGKSNNFVFTFCIIIIIDIIDRDNAMCNMQL